MGFEGQAVLEVLDQAIKEQNAQVRLVAYDLSERDIVSRLEELDNRLKHIGEAQVKSGLVRARFVFPILPVGLHGHVGNRIIGNAIGENRTVIFGIGCVGRGRLLLRIKPLPAQERDYILLGVLHQYG